jgi:hypothetical protein
MKNTCDVSRKTGPDNGALGRQRQDMPIYKIYASLDDHIGEGFVWLQKSDLLACFIHERAR